METNVTKILKQAIAGDTDAMIDLGRIYVYKKDDFENGLYWLKRALNQGNNDAIIEIARAYEQIDYMNSKKYDSAVIDYELSDETIEWYQKALSFYEGNYQVKPDYAFMAGELLSGVDAIEIDHQKAFQYFLYIANLEDDDHVIVNIARGRVAKMYRIGMGCERDLEKSKFYREKVNYGEEFYHYKFMR